MDRLALTFIVHAWREAKRVISLLPPGGAVIVHAWTEAMRAD